MESVSKFSVPDAINIGAKSLYLLRQAWGYARELQRDRWEFAVELSTLCSSGLTINDVRWLVYQGFAEHGRDISAEYDSDRRFESGGPLLPKSGVCVVLTNRGASALGLAELPLSDATQAVRPQWDDDRGELWYGRELVKRFKLPSKNQRAVLMAFEEENWPRRIDDPLSYDPEIHPARRLNATILRLNRSQVNVRIRFRADGSGTGIGWSATQEEGGPGRSD